MKRKKPDWLPDWQNVSAYPGDSQVTGSRWSWEFLRRNSQYQDDYDKLAEGNSTLASLWRNLEMTDGLSSLAVNGKPKEIHEKETEGNAFIRAMQAKYGIRKGLLPPAPWQADHANIFELTTMYAYSGEKQPNEEILKFDLTMPFEPQLRMAKRILESHKYQHIPDVRHRVDLFPQYLRLLDGEVSGATQDEMSKIIYPHIKNTHPDFSGRDRVKKALNAARRLRDGDYRLLPL